MDGVVDCPQTSSDEGTAPMYTRVNYTYRDASNYKQFGSVLLDGVISEEEKCLVTATLDDGDGHFIPEQIGWPHPGKTMDSWPSEDDHCWAEIDMEDPAVFEVVAVHERRTVEPVLGTVEMWLRQMIEAKAIGWNDARYGVDA